jgi:hypothetical protein
VRGTYRALETSHCYGTRDAPKEGDIYGNGVLRVVVEGTIHREDEKVVLRREGAQVVRPHPPYGTRNA